MTLPSKPESPTPTPDPTERRDGGGGSFSDKSRSNQLELQRTADGTGGHTSTKRPATGQLGPRRHRGGEEQKKIRQKENSRNYRKDILDAWFIDTLGDKLGKERYRAVQNLERWLGRHEDVNHKFFNPATFPQGRKRFLIDAVLDFAPRAQSDYDDAVLEQLRRGWQLFKEQREAEARLVAEVLLRDIQVRPCAHADRVSLECRELILDCGIPVTTSLIDAVNRADQMCDALIAGWRALNEPQAFILNLERKANLGRAYPFVSARSAKEAREIIDAAERLVGLPVANDAGRILLQREAEHRKFQLLVKGGFSREANNVIKAVVDLGFRAETRMAKIHSLALAASHWTALDRTDKARDLLSLAWGEMKGETLPRTTSWCVLRADIETCRKEGNVDRADTLINSFADLHEPYACAYQQRNLQRWRPRFLGGTPYGQRIVTVVLPPLVDLFLGRIERG